MNINLLPAAVVEWLKSQGTTLLQAGKDAQALNFEVGKTYEGRLLQNLPAGRALVQVANQLLDMALPKGNKPGDTVRLTYLKAAPHPTFLLQPQPGRASEGQAVRLSEAASKIATLVRWAGNAQMPAQPAAQQGAASPGQAMAKTAQAASNPEQATARATQAKQLASAAGLGIRGAAIASNNQVGSVAANPGPAVALGKQVPVDAALLAGGRAASLPQATTGASPSLLASTVALSSTSPLLEEASGEAEAWVGPLRQAVKASGMFYEAHQVRWVRGEQTLADIQREPQAKLNQAEFAGTRVAELDGMPQDAARLAGRQLQMLEGQPFVWQGQAWPGQMLQWQIEERPDGEGDGEQEPAAWRTQMRLKLPRLGGVFAEINLMSQGLKFRLRADDPETLSAMREALPLLTNRLDAAGLAVLGVQIESGFDAQEEGVGDERAG